MEIGKDANLEFCPVADVAHIIKQFTDPKTIYGFTKNEEGFDAFLPPNNFLCFTTTIQEDKKGNHLIPLNTALTLCEEMEKRNEVVNFITAVPKDQLSIWKKEQSFKVSVKNYPEIARAFKKTTGDFQTVKGKLPLKYQSKLCRFQQFVSTVTMKRKFHSYIQKGK